MGSIGIYINENFLGSKVTYFQWKIAGLFHDIGYPLEVTGKINQELYVNTINNTGKKIDCDTPAIKIRVIPARLKNLKNSVNSLDLIQKCLDGWGLSINAKNEYKQMITSGEINHGIISSLTVLYILDLSYSKYNPGRLYSYCPVKIGGVEVDCNQEHFDKDIVSACSAIFIHNLLARCFSKNKISPTEAPLAFLLKLSDCLQDWERPSKEYLKGISDDQYDIDIGGGKLIFTIKNKGRHEKIKEEIDATLEHSSKIEIKYNP